MLAASAVNNCALEGEDISANIRTLLMDAPVSCAINSIEPVVERCTAGAEDLVERALEPKRCDRTFMILRKYHRKKVRSRNRLSHGKTNARSDIFRVGVFLS